MAERTSSAQLWDINIVPGSSPDQGHCVALAMAWAMDINSDPYCCKTRDEDMFLCGSMGPDISMVSGGCAGYACVAVSPRSPIFGSVSLCSAQSVLLLPLYCHSSKYFLIVVVPAPPVLHGCRPLWFWCLSPLHWVPGVDPWVQLYRLGISLHKVCLI